MPGASRDKAGTNRDKQGQSMPVPVCPGVNQVSLLSSDSIPPPPPIFLLPYPPLLPGLSSPPPPPPPHLPILISLPLPQVKEVLWDVCR